MLRTVSLATLVFITAVRVHAVRLPCVAKVIVNRAALYEEGHFGEEDHIIDWLKYGARISEVGPITFRGENSPGIAHVTLADGRMGLMDWSTFGSFAEISVDEAIVYDETFTDQRFVLKRGDRVGIPYSLPGSENFYTTKILTKNGLTGRVPIETLTTIPPSGKRAKTLTEEGPSTSIQGVGR